MRPARSTRLLLPLALAFLTAPAGAQVVLQNLDVQAVDDAELTPDGRLVVLREHTSLNSQARVLDTRSGESLTVVSPTMGGLNGAAQDAVAVTNGRAVVIGSSAVVLDLFDPGLPVLAEHEVGDFPRDLAITPDGTRCVVRGGSGPSGGLYVLDLASGAVLASFPGLPGPVPGTSFDVDSVVATDRHGVLLSWVPAPVDRARVTVLDLQPAGGGTPVVVLETGMGSPAIDQLGAPHDLTLTDGGDYAVVRSELSVALYRLEGAATNQVWHKRLWGAPGPLGGSALDSIEATADRIATISRRSSGSAGAQLDVFDLAGNQWHAPMLGDPHDLEITPDGTRLLVRTSAGVYLFDLVQLPATPLLQALDSAAVASSATSFGAGLDSVAVTDTRAVTLHRQDLRTEVRLWDLSGDKLIPAGTLDLPNKPCDVAISPNGRWAAVTGTDHVQVIDLIAGRLALNHDPAVSSIGQFPWCDGVVLDDERVVAFGYTSVSTFPFEGWVSVVDLDLGAYEYCPATASSTGLAGKLEPTGSTSIALNSTGLLATQLPAATVGAFVFGSQSTWLPFGDGTLCVSGERYTPGPVFTDPTGTAFQPLDFLGAPSQGGVIQAGTTWYFQVWYRDRNSAGTGLNTTNGVKLSFQS